MEVSIAKQIEQWSKEILSTEFKQKCAKHMLELGYTSKTSGDQLCIINSEGENSCQPGTLVGWKFVNEIETYLASNGFPWFTAERTQEELVKASSITSPLTKEITELIKNDN